jgi:RNA polymerase sigma factor (TIGR02999 family)
LAQNSLTNVLQSQNAPHESIQGSAFNNLIELCYTQLRNMAGTRVRNAGEISISPTELLHEAIIGVSDASGHIKNKEHFLATMSLKMRSLLVDHARHNLADKRGGDQLRITFTEQDIEGSDSSFELLALDEAFQRLDEIEPRSAQVMHLSYFAGMLRDDIAKLLDISLPTVDRELRFGRAFTMDSMRNDK